MSRNDHQLRDALSEIASIANAAVDNGYSKNTQRKPSTDPDVKRPDLPTCTLRLLPSRLLSKAARTAIKINPLNAPFLAPIEGGTLDIAEPARLTLLVSKYWGRSSRQLTVSFVESTPDDLRKRILSHMNAWTKTVSISFVATNDVGDVRISRGPGGYYSYLGTDILHIPNNRQTMNLQGFTMNTSESEYRRVVRHETGHTLGFPHEHMRKELVARIDPQKAYDYFWRTQGWDKSTVDAQVLTSLDDSAILGTPPDETSIMCYQLPGAITRDGEPILGGTDINDTDYQFAGEVYPKAAQTITSYGVEPYPVTADWDQADDVEVAV